MAVTKRRSAKRIVDSVGGYGTLAGELTTERRGWDDLA